MIQKSIITYSVIWLILPIISQWDVYAEAPIIAPITGGGSSPCRPIRRSSGGSTLFLFVDFRGTNPKQLGFMDVQQFS